MSLDRSCWLEHETSTGTKCIYDNIDAYSLAIALENENVKLQSYSDNEIQEFKFFNDYSDWKTEILGIHWIYLKDLLSQYKLPETIFEGSDNPYIQPDCFRSMEEAYNKVKTELKILSALSEKYPDAKIVYLIEN
jgi:hypothetical protein